MFPVRAPLKENLTGKSYCCVSYLLGIFNVKCKARCLLQFIPVLPISSDNQSFNQSIDQLINQTDSEPINKPINQSITGSMKEL